MATRKTSAVGAKTKTRKTASASKTSAPRNVPTRGKITKTQIVFRLTPAEVKKAQECLARSGSITYTFKDIRVSKLPQILDDGKLID